MYLATCRAALYHGTSSNVVGDPMDVNDATTLVTLWASFPASLIESMRRIYDPASEAQRTIRRCTGHVPLRLPIVAGDRIKDLGTGRLYVLDEITSAGRNLAGMRDLILDLRIVDDLFA
jgi:hypothetical protein